MENSSDDQSNLKKSSILDPIVQYIAIRNDLKWQKGALIAQGAHSSIAAIHLNYSDRETISYLADLDKMHKIVIGVSSQDELKELSSELSKADIKFKLWMEQPENIPVSLATKPYHKSNVEKFFQKFKLFK